MILYVFSLQETTKKQKKNQENSVSPYDYQIRRAAEQSKRNREELKTC